MRSHNFPFYLICCVIVSLFIVSCTKESGEKESDSNTEVENIDPNFDPNSKDTTFSNAITIVYSDTLISITNPFESKGILIVEEDGNVVITSTNTEIEVNYVLSGIIKRGSFKIYSDYKFGLILNGVGIFSSDRPAINIQSGKKVSINLVEETNNRLSDGNTYTTSENNEDIKAALFSEGQLIFSGNGILEVQGNYKHGICSDDYIRIIEGTIKVVNSLSDGIHSNDYFKMEGGTLSVNSVGEGIECEKGYVEIVGGVVTVKTTGSKGMGIKSKTYTTINSIDNINITVSGTASKGIKTGSDFTCTNGNISIITTGDAFYDTSDADISSAAGIKCDGNLVVERGTISIASSGKAGKGINVDGTIVINGGTIVVTTTGGQFVYGSDDSAAKAIKSDGNLTINGGYIAIKTSGVEAEGIESKDTLKINGGTIEVEAYDDCLNASKHIEITGGNIYCYSTTNDGIDSNGTLSISGGVVVSAGASSPEAGIDCDQSTFKITGGTVVGIGGSTSNPTSNVSTQYSLVYGSSTNSVQIIHIESSDGSNEVLTFKLPRTYNQMTLLLSSPNLKANTGYTIYTGGSISGGTDFHGLHSNATYTKGASATTFTTTSVVTNLGNSNNPGTGRPR